MIRCAIPGDARAVANLLLRARGELNHSLDIQEDVAKAERTLANFAASPAHFFCVIDVGGEIVGALIGMLAPLWWARDDVVVDLLFYVAPEHRGRGLPLLRRYVSWAKGFDSVRRIIISNGANERVALLYGRMGFVRHNNTFVMEV